MRSVIFENKGEIDVQAITTFGVNVKETDNPIGYFGTGLKYAIAVLLRKKCKVRISSGTDVYEFATEIGPVRGVDFNFVTMNGKRCGFTTDLGKNWKTWMAYRELHCNTIDEDGETKVKRWGKLKPKAGRTRIQVSGQKVMNAHVKREQFLLGDRNLIESGRRCDAYEGSTYGIFYRGIRIKELRSHPTVMRYDITSSVTLTEDRTARYEHELYFPIMELILRSDNKEFVEKALSAEKGTYEWDLDFHNATSDPSETFLAVVGELREKTKDVGLNMSLVVLHKDKVTDSMLPTESDVKLNDIQLAQLTKAKTFVHSVIGCNMYKFPIVVVKSLGKYGLGRAENGTIYIAVECFEQGTKRVAAALYEEFIHLEHEVADETLEQKWIYLQKILSLGEQLSGDPL